MVPIIFPPGLYGATNWAFTIPKELPDELLKQIFVEARTRVLEELHRTYFNAVETYELPSRTEEWIENVPLPAFAQEAGKIYVTLDYFTACLPLPKRMKRPGARKEAVLYEYFSQRSVDNLQANSAALLRTLGISSLIPDEWFPQKNLEKLIEKEIQRSGVYTHVEIDFDLGIPPGGLHWLSEATEQTMTKIREKLALGQPWPVRLVRSPGRLEGNPQVIVFACQEQKGGKLRLEIFEPDNPLEEHALQIIKRRERAEVTEILGSGRHLPVLGLLYEAYAAAPLPEECIPWWLRWMMVRRVWIRMLAWMQKKHLLKLF
jgi:hypothetical protein